MKALYTNVYRLRGYLLGARIQGCYNLAATPLYRRSRVVEPISGHSCIYIELAQWEVSDQFLSYPVINSSPLILPIAGGLLVSYRRPY